MLPKIDSDEWSNWGLVQKLDALNTAIQKILQPCEKPVDNPLPEEPKKRGRKKASQSNS